MHLIKALVAVWLLIPASVLAERYGFRHYGHEEGLNNLVVECMLQDETGFLWVGTQHGLFRFDGRRFREYRHEDGLPSTWIHSVHQDSQGALWVATHAGLARLRGERFEAIDLGVPYEIHSWNSLASDDEYLYVSTSVGLYRGTSMEGVDYVFELLAHGSEELASEVHGVYVSPDGALWFGCGDGLCQYAGGKATRYGPEDGVPNDRWDALVVDGRGGLWARSSRQLLVREAGESGFKLHEHELPQSAECGVLSTDHAGRLLIPTDHGLRRETPNGWQTIGSSQGLYTNATSRALEDREGSIWIGLNGAGLARWVGHEEWVGWSSSEGLTHDAVWCMRRDPNGALWIGTDNGLNRMPVGQEGWKSWTAELGLGQTRVQAVAVAADGSVFAGCSPGGLKQVFPGSGKVIHYGAGNGLPAERINYLFIDSKQQLWVSSHKGFFQSTPLTGEIAIPTASTAGRRRE